MSKELIEVFKNILKTIFSDIGYTIQRRDRLPPPMRTMDCVFKGIVQRNHIFNTVIDIGASDGRWSDSLFKYYPKVKYLLIEAQPTHSKDLEKFCNAHRNIQFVLKAAGEAPGQIFFDASDPLGGQASYVPYEKNNIEIPVTTIDFEIQSRKLHGPYLMKFDTHGFEVPILKGASQTLLDTEVIIIECYNFKIAPECLLFFEMCDFLKEFGFRCIDLVDPLYRPYDDSLWQMDLVFVKDNRPEFIYLGYQ